VKQAVAPLNIIPDSASGVPVQAGGLRQQRDIRKGVSLSFDNWQKKEENKKKQRKGTMKHFIAVFANISANVCKHFVKSL
jgi:hypothetical protein